MCLLMAKKITKTNRELLVEAHKINYRLRSTFFYRKLHEYKTLDYPKTITNLIPHSKHYSWEDYLNWGVSESAYVIIKNSNLDLIEVFSHPKLLREHPRLIGYYRNVSVLSQKATTYITGINTLRFEEKGKTNLKESQALSLAMLFNQHISLIIDSTLGELHQDEIKGLLFASTGAQIDGSWRNSIGEEAEKVVQTLLSQEVIKGKLLVAFIMRSNGDIVTPDKETTERIIKNIRDIKGLMLTNKKSILFSSEPDITVIDKTGKSQMVIEVKGGTDPAGALERYGAAKKSFEHSLAENRTVKTCLVASCITPEVEKRVKLDSTITRYFNLTSVLTDDKIKSSLIEFIMKVVIK